MSEQKSPPVSEEHTEHGEAHSPHDHAPEMSKLLIPVAIVILLFLGIYGGLAFKGLPQQWTKVAISGHGEHDADHAALASESTPETPVEAVSTPEAPTTEGDSTEQPATQPAAEKPAEAAGHAKEDDHSAKHHPPYYMIAPFAILLLCIAVLPLIPATEHWWESNANRFLVAAGLGLVTLLYYAFLCDFPVELHWPGHAVVDPVKADGTRNGFAVASTVFINAILGEYIAFIVLLFSLFTISGGIRISGDLKASPFVNSVILLIGAVLASFIGTTGAAMLLIRLLLETNQQRKYKVHTVIIFIFCVCNCGGCLTPLGDPPLFLGYLRGVAFTWTFNLWMEWMFVNLILIAFYFLWDTVWYYPKESKNDKLRDLAEKTPLSIKGIALNAPLLAGVILAVAFLDPTKPVPVIGETLFPENNGHPWYFLREAVQLGLCALSLLLGSKAIRKANTFNFMAIGEVAALFFGIFICMQAPLQILNVEGPNIVAKMEEKTGIDKKKLFFAATGSLSSVLDNAPTYVVFFETAKTLTPNSDEELHSDRNEDGTPKWIKDENGQWWSSDKKMKLVHVGNGYLDHYLLVAVALGSVFMGAMTYIGNGPNFMVKAIAEQSGVKMPSFFGYIGYSVVILLPILVMMVLIFL